MSIGSTAAVSLPASQPDSDTALLTAVAELATRHDGHTSAEQIAQAQDIPQKFLQTILCDLRRAGTAS